MRQLLGGRGGGEARRRGGGEGEGNRGIQSGVKCMESRRKEVIERGRNRMGEKKEESGRGWLEEGREEGREREEGGD